jgi:hypothetical protein
MDIQKGDQREIRWERFYAIYWNRVFCAAFWTLQIAQNGI